MDKKQEIYNSLSLQDKCKLFVGKNFWELEAINNKNIFLSDGPHGIRKEIFYKGQDHPEIVKATCYPAACLSACSFNKELFVEYGKQLAKEAIKNNVDVILGPGVNIKRNPLCGRNFEYFSEDPYLSGVLSANYIKGVQSLNVGCCLKHLACNSQELARFINNSIIDERTLREIYLKAFEIAIKESKPYAIMASYNLLNGTHTTENKYLLTDIVRNEFNFDGIYMSDWGALSNPIKSLQAGLDLEMPGVSKGSEYLIYQAIKNNELDEEVLNSSTKRLIDLYLKVSKNKVNDFNQVKALSMAKQINDESIVLLKNKDHILPLNKDNSIALIGDLAINPRIQGGGSSQINAIGVTSLFNEFAEEGLNFKFAKGYNREDIKGNKKLIKQAVNVASTCDVVVVMLGLPRIIESEGYDRDHMRLPIGQLTLIDELIKVNKNIIVLLQNGSAIELPFIDKIKGLLECYLGGSAHANSIKDILLGKVNPSGRLAESFPIKYEDVISCDYYLDNPYYSLYKEGIYVGYRYYDSFNIPVLFPFGYGLSYSEVVYSNLKVMALDNRFSISVTLTNKSVIPTKEVVQLYVGQINPSINKVKKELKGFDKVLLNPKESKTITLYINNDDLKYYSNKQHRYILESGTYRFYIAKHVNDESLYQDKLIKGDDIKETLSVSYDDIANISDEEFLKSINYQADLKHKRKPYTIESPIKDLAKNPLGFVVFGIAKHQLVKGLNIYDKKMYNMSIPYQPIRSIQMVAPLSKNFIEGIVTLFNGHPIKGIKMMKDKTKVL